MLLKKINFHPCHHLSSLLLLVCNRNDSNRDDRKYAYSYLLYILEEKNLKCLHSNIDAYDTFSALGHFFLISAFCASKKVGNRDDIYRGYSNFLLNMAFISSSEVENIYIS